MKKEVKVWDAGRRVWPVLWDGPSWMMCVEWAGWGEGCDGG